MKRMQQKKKAYVTAIMAFLMFSIVLASMPMANAAGAITLTPTTQTVGASVTVDGTGFGATNAVGIGFGAEVNASETMSVTGPYDVGNGPYIGYLSHLPIKPGTYRKAINITSTVWTVVDTDNGNGTFRSGLTSYFVNGTIDYVTGQVTLFLNTPLSLSMFYASLVNYTYYQYNVTPAAGVTTLATGTFQAAITVPNVFSRNYDITAIDTQGNIATAPLTVTGGASVWDKTYGGTGSDTGTGETVQTSDGGYAISGDTNSSGAGGLDFWLIKTDATGNMIWNKTYGGALDEVCEDMCQTNDGGYAMAGYTTSFGAGGQDFWLVKTDAAGKADWTKSYGGTGNEYALHVVQSIDGGYVMTGYTNSFGAGGDDVWLIKTNAAGNMQWNKTYGATGADYGQSLVQSSDGGYAIPGYTTSFGGYKVYLVKTDASGNMQWNKTYGTTAIEIGIHGIQTADGGYAMVGWNYANGQDFVLVKTDATGNLQWEMTYGGTGVENGYALLQASDGGYVLTGNTNSFGAGGNDIWLVKVDELGVIPEGLTIGVMMLLATVAVIVSSRYFRKRPKIENCSQVKL